MFCNIDFFYQTGTWEQRNIWLPAKRESRGGHYRFISEYSLSDEIVSNDSNHMYYFGFSQRPPEKAINWHRHIFFSKGKPSPFGLSWEVKLLFIYTLTPGSESRRLWSLPLCTPEEPQLPLRLPGIPRKLNSRRRRCVGLQGQELRQEAASHLPVVC